MKKKLVALLAIAGLTVIAYMLVPKTWEQSWSHWKSGMVGLDRKVILFTNDGSVIKEWKGRYNVETNGNVARFIDHGKTVMISGTFVVEEQ